MNFLKRRNDFSNSPSGPKGKRLYAIGDVHGCLDKLLALINMINISDETLPKKSTFVVLLGDLIDRGPDSAGVVQWAQEFSANRPNYHFLMGNHEDIFLKAVRGDLEALDKWLIYGGEETLVSYGIDPSFIKNNDLDTILITIKKKIPKSHIEFLSSFLDSIEFGDYFLVHAGVDPSLKLEEQNRDAFLWIREPFLSYKKKLEKIIVHGHTIEERVTLHNHRISVDTGAYDGGPLSAVCLEDDTHRVIECFPEDVKKFKDQQTH